MTRIILTGCNGKMGAVVSGYAKKQEDCVIVAGLDRSSDQKWDYPVFTDLASCNIPADVVLDFSNAGGLETSLQLALAHKLPLVVAATGHTEEQLAQLHEASTQIPVFRSANLSLGINLLLELVKKAAAVLGSSCDIELVEKHHNQKIDAPSGTALMIANTIASALPEQPEFVYDRHDRHEKRPPNEIGVHTIRGGTIVGEHTALFIGQDEVLEIKHEALSKEIFAVGAFRACSFLAKQAPGEYNMQDLVAAIGG